MKYPKYKVCCRCFTFNQAEYITDAMNGFTMQQTSFPFVCCIVDDASTDGEQEVIRKYVDENFNLSEDSVAFQRETEYAHVTYAQHKINKNCYFAVLLLNENLYSKHYKKNEYISEWTENVPYIAECEGDDYWIVSNKLQRQYDVLESDRTISLCHHNFLFRKGNDLYPRKTSIPQRQNLISIAEYNTVQTLSMFYRNTSEPLVPKAFAEHRYVYQYFWNLRLAEYGDIYYLDEIMGVYRQVSGVYSQKSDYDKVKMGLYNNDNMIEWFTNWHPNQSVVFVLKRRARKMVVKLFLSKLKRGDIMECIKLIRLYLKYI